MVNDIPPWMLVVASVQKSTKAWSIMCGDEPIACFGVSPIRPGWGAPWLLGTPHLPKHAIKFLRHCPSYVDEMHEEYSHLENYVHAANTLSIRWLRWLGFKILPMVKHGHSNEFFFPFMRIHPCV